MVRAIIFDCFGVLTSDGWTPFKKKHFTGDAAREEQAGDLSRRLNAGQFSYDVFVNEIADLADVSTHEARGAVQNNVAHEDLLEYIKHTLKPKYKIGMLSNAGTNMLDDLFTPDQVALFDVVALSYESNFMKPDPRAYESVAERLGVEVGECVFIDDLERYCTAAREAGMQAVWYRDFEQMKRDLEQLL